MKAKIVFLLALILAASGCGATQSAVHDSASLPPDESRKVTVLENSIAGDVVDLSDRFDSILGLVMTQDGVLVAAGEKEGVPYVSLMDANGAEHHGFVPEQPGNSHREAPEALVSICENVGSGFTLCYSSALAVYDSKGNHTDTIETGKLAEYLNPPRIVSDVAEEVLTAAGISYSGPFHLKDDQYLFWNENRIWIFERDGTRLLTEDSRDTRFQAFLHRKEDAFVFAETKSGVQMFSVEPDGKKIEFAVSLQDLSNIYDMHYSGDMNDVFFLCGDNSVYSCASSGFENDSTEFLFRFADAGLNSGITSLVKAGESAMIITPRMKPEFQRITIQKEKTEKKVITVGCISRDDYPAFTLLDYIDYFQSRYPDYKIELKKYDIDHQDPLRTDFIAGIVPDVVCYNAMDIPMTNTWFIDLFPYLEADETLSREDFVEQIFDKTLIDGQMLCAVLTVDLMTIAARESDVGDVMTWTTADVLKLLEDNPDRYSFHSFHKTRIRGWIQMASNAQFIDDNTMTCDFQSKSFYSLLMFCEKVTDRIAPEYIDDYFDKSILFDLFDPWSLGSLDSLSRNYHGDKVQLIGFPNDEGKTASFFTPSRLSLAIPQKSQNKDDAWMFIRGMYDAEFINMSDDELYYVGIPLLKDALAYQAEKVVNHPNTIITKEEMDDYLNQILQADFIINYDKTITDIIIEEMSSFYEGQKSAEEVAAVIQSRVSMYLAEKQ